MKERLHLLTSLSWRNLWRNPRRTGLVLLAIGVGVWSMLAFTSLLQAWSRSNLATALQDLTGHAQVHAPGYLDDPGVAHSFDFPSGALRTTLDTPPITAWAPRVRVPATLQSEYQTWPISMVGIDPSRERGLSFISDAMTQGRSLSGSGDSGILLGRKLLRRLHTSLGKRVVLLSQDRSGALAERGFQVVGVFSAAPEVEGRVVFVGLNQAQSMLAMGDQISEVALKVKDLQQLPAVQGSLRAAAPSLDVQTWETLRPMVVAMNRLSDGFIQVWTVIMFLLMSFGMVNTLLMSLHERVRELALFQALGLRPRLVFAQVTLESSLVILLGVAGGGTLAASTILVFHHGLNLGFLARGSEWLGAGRVMYPQIAWSTWTEIGVLVWVLGTVAGLLPGWRAIQRVPVEAINRSQM